jgi:predicted dehydrogenase
VTAVVSHAALGLQVEDLGVATFGWHSGLVAELTASFCFAAADVSIELYGSLGTVLVSAVDLASRDITHGHFVRIHRRAPGGQPDGAPAWETVAITPQFKVGQFHQQNALAFIDCLVGGTAPPVSLDDGQRALRMIDSAYRAALSGCRQEIHE